MAVFTYTSNESASFSSFDTWANTIDGLSQISLESAYSELFPTDSQPHNVSLVRGESIFFGNFIADIGGLVQMSAPYTVNSTGSFKADNIIISDYAITVTATATYPYSFNSWRDAPGGSGNSLSFSSTLTLTDTDHTDVTDFYAFFATTHIDP
tara:strand:+ start:2440 stop:2898 length:459 start_codon:yes stop_codon:yes gene_type:complete